MRGTLALLMMITASPAVANWRIAASGRYTCPDGSEAVMVQQPYGVSLKRLGREIALKRSPTWSGFAYAGEGIKVRGRGAEGAKTLRLEQPDRGPMECKAVPAVATPGVATGTVTSLLRMALPPDAILRVELRDTALADAAVPLLAATEMRIGGNQLPLHWRLDYKPAAITSRSRPALSARVVADDRLVMISDTFTPLPVPSGRAHPEAEIRLVAVRAAPSPSSK